MSRPFYFQCGSFSAVNWPLSICAGLFAVHSMRVPCWLVGVGHPRMRGLLGGPTCGGVQVGCGAAEGWLQGPGACSAIRTGRGLRHAAPGRARPGGLQESFSPPLRRERADFHQIFFTAEYSSAVLISPDGTPSEVSLQA